jgi:hypothetical protein
MLHRSNRPRIDDARAIRDVESCCEAGEIWPTFVTPDDARRYIDEVDSGYSRLDTAIQASNVPTDFKVSWGIQLGTWKTFALSAKPSVGWFNTKAVMEQTDRFNAELKNWYTGFQTVGGKPSSPPPLPPGQGIPDPNPASVKDITTLGLVVGGIAALVIFGPKLARVL